MPFAMHRLGVQAAVLVRPSDWHEFPPGLLCCPHNRQWHTACPSVIGLQVAAFTCVGHARNSLGACQRDLILAQLCFKVQLSGVPTDVLSYNRLAWDIFLVEGSLMLGRLSQPERGHGSVAQHLSMGWRQVTRVSCLVPRHLRGLMSTMELESILGLPQGVCG